MKDIGRGIVVTRTLEFPLPPSPGLMIYGQQLDECPEPVGWSDTKSQRIERLTKPMIERLLHVLEAKKNVRRDRECEQRQNQRVKEKRQAQAQQDSRACYWQQELRQRVPGVL